MIVSAQRRLAQAVLGGALVGVLGLSAGLAPVQADRLDDKKDQIDQQVTESKEDLEDLNSTLVEAAAKLAKYQDQLPVAQQKLATAQTRVSDAQSKVSALQARLSQAQASRTSLSAARTKRTEDSQKNQQLAGQIAAQAYRQGGVSSGGDFDMLFSGGNPSEVAGSMEMANRVMASQNRVLDSLRSQAAQDTNDAARLTAVENEIADLKKQADNALADQRNARDEAQAAKETVDRLLAETKTAQDSLKGQIVTVKDQLAQQKKDQADVNQAIKVRQEKLKREAEEAARKAQALADAKRKAAREAAKRKAANAAKLEREANDAETKANAAKDDATPSGTVSASSWGLIVPADSSGYVSSGYGWRPTPAGTIDYGGAGGYVHAGIDWGFRGQCGALIKAAAAGKVEWAGWKGTHGQIVSLDHKITKGHALTTNYNHMSRVAVSVGQRVKQGQVIGYVGSTGNSTGCHLHFETVVDGSTRDPAGLLW